MKRRENKPASQEMNIDLNELYHPVEAMTQILRVDRTSESIQTGLETLSSTPLSLVAKTLLLHGVGPSLFVLSGAKSSAEDLGSRGLYRLLKGQYALSEKRLAIARTLLSQSVECLNRAGIQPLLVKGILLAESIYPDPAMRLFSDIDFFVSPQEYPKAKEALSIFQKASDKNGFTYFVANAKASFDLKFGIDLHQYGFTSADSSREVELFGFKLNGNPEMREIYETSEISESPFGQIRRMQPYFILRYLCRHCMKHLISGTADLRGLCDIAFLLHHMGNFLEWETVLPWQVHDSASVKDRDGNVFYTPLLLASRWLGAPVSDDVLNRLRTVTSRSIQRRALIEASTFGAMSCGHLSPYLASGLWCPWYKFWPRLIQRAFPSVQTLKGKVFLDRSLHPMVRYYHWYRYVWQRHLKPMVQILLKKSVLR
jgi:hypothetical protein